MKMNLAAAVQKARALVKDIGPDRCLLALLVVVAALFLLQGVRYGVNAIRAGRLIAALEEYTGTPPGRKDAQPIEYYNAIYEKGVLGKGPQPPPPAKVFGILGDTALVGTEPDKAKPFQVGAEIPGGEKIIEIRPNEVVFEKDGKQRIATVFPGGDKKPEPGAGPQPGPPNGVPPGAQPNGAPPNGAPPPGGPPNGAPPNGVQLQGGPLPPGAKEGRLYSIRVE
ncbi:MAG: hypothetical protein JXR94_12760 [Candidatus Hydrogenedentes bacterium]|nr:hypothetical protein [Candidatus Hydrogenedentota bacterium]